MWGESGDFPAEFPTNTIYQESNCVLEPEKRYGGKGVLGEDEFEFGVAGWLGKQYIMDLDGASGFTPFLPSDKIYAPPPLASLSQQEFNFQFFRGPTTPPFPSPFCQKHAWPPSVIFSNNIGKIPSVSQSPPPSLLPLFSLFGSSHALAEMLQWFPEKEQRKKFKKGRILKGKRKKCSPPPPPLGIFAPLSFLFLFSTRKMALYTGGQETHFRPNIASMFQEVFEENAKIFQGIFGSNRK